MCLAQGPQRSDASEARTRDPSVSSHVLYHWAIALPNILVIKFNILSLSKFNFFSFFLEEAKGIYK